jgi:hypothetical protein
VISSINQRHYVVTFFVNSEIREVIVRKTNALKERAQLGRLKELDLVTVVYKKDDPNQAVIYELSEQKVA